MKLRWRFGVIAGLFLAVFSLYPQLKLAYLRADDWNGNYSYNDIDEVAYAGYLNALIDGRPRKNDPYSGHDDAPDDPQPESLFSIQFAGPYTIAIPARLLGIGTPVAMTVTGALAAFLTALALFWLLGMITGDSLSAMAGSLFVLCGGALFAGEGAIGEILGSGFSYPYFPGFRRYIPAIAFPAFFALVGLLWRLVGDTGDDSKDDPKTVGLRPQIFLIGLSALAFSYTVYTYFYVWTTAAAWLACLGICLLVLRPDGIQKDIKRLAALGVLCGVSLIPYAYLLSQRAATMDEMTMLVKTRALDLARMPELICVVVLVVIAVAALLKMLKLRDRGTIFAISLALTPFVVFNQQAITGESLQPIHYQVFIGNYVAGLAVVVTMGLIWRTAEGRSSMSARLALVCLSLAGAAWGFVECHYTVRVLDDANVIRDEAYPVLRRLSALAKAEAAPTKRVVLAFGIAESDEVPSVAAQSVLWARHQHVFAGLSWQESKERYYQQLYYEGISPQRLAERMKSGEDFVSMIALFGWGRHTDRLNSAYTPLTFGEINKEAEAFGDYMQKLDDQTISGTALDYVIAPLDYDVSFEKIDKRYIRDTGEQFGKYILYKLSPR